MSEVRQQYTVVENKKIKLGHFTMGWDVHCCLTFGVPGNGVGLRPGGNGWAKY